MAVDEIMKRKKTWKLEETTDDWKSNNLEEIKKRLSGWQLDSFNESYEYKINNGMSLFKKNLKNE
jgi:non-homologous end joining protein Ku